MWVFWRRAPCLPGTEERVFPPHQDDLAAGMTALESAQAVCEPGIPVFFHQRELRGDLPAVRTPHAGAIQSGDTGHTMGKAVKAQLHAFGQIRRTACDEDLYPFLSVV